MRGILLVVALLLIPLASASSISLLAYSEGGQGSIATLSLETRQGSGKVFIETNVLMQTDTQHSIRLAKDIVCTNYDLPCTQYDFYYSIQGISSTVMGPSGGAAAAVLTFAHMTDRTIPSRIAITGTINSGGFVGPVGGLDQKISAANNRNLRTVYLPFGNSVVSINDTSVSLTDIAGSVRLLEVGSLDDIFYDLFKIPVPEVNFIRPPLYQERMIAISESICESAFDLLENIVLEDLLIKNSSPRNITQWYTSAENLVERAHNETLLDNFYSAASFCFGANLRLRYLSFLDMNLDDIETKVISALELAKSRQQFSFDDINDIQVHALVAERLHDAVRGLEQAHEFLSENNTDAAIDRFAFSYERSQTALLWSTFFGIPGTSVDLTPNEFAQACEFTIREAQDRIQYVRFYTSLPLEAEQTLTNARSEQSLQQYPVCILYAKKAKAEADVVASVFGLTDLSDILAVKQRIAKQFVGSRTTEHQIPLIGLSYVEYGTSLMESDPYAALLYFQLAQELANIDIFFKGEESEVISYNWDPRILIFLGGVLLGLLLASLIAPVNSVYKRKE